MKKLTIKDFYNIIKSISINISKNNILTKDKKYFLSEIKDKELKDFINKLNTTEFYYIKSLLLIFNKIEDKVNIEDEGCKLLILILKTVLKHIDDCDEMYLNLPTIKLFSADITDLIDEEFYSEIVYYNINVVKLFNLRNEISKLLYYLDTITLNLRTKKVSEIDNILDIVATELINVKSIYDDYNNAVIYLNSRKTIRLINYNIEGENIISLSCSLPKKLHNYFNNSDRVVFVTENCEAVIGFSLSLDRHFRDFYFDRNEIHIDNKLEELKNKKMTCYLLTDSARVIAKKPGYITTEIDDDIKLQIKTDFKIYNYKKIGLTIDGEKLIEFLEFYLNFFNDMNRFMPKY